MKLLALKVNCPICNSDNVTYTCEPKCCFNHICGSCYATFELGTEPTGREIETSDLPQEERDCLAPTTACARCESLDVYLVEDEQLSPDTLVCASCHALLNLVIESVKPR